MSPNSIGGTAGAVSADGRFIIGGDSVGCDSNANCTGIGWIWHNGQYQSINTLVGVPAGLPLYASGISGDGSALVLSNYDTDQSYLWRDGALTALSSGEPAWLVQDWATTISDDGQTVAGFRFEVQSSMEAWQWRGGDRIPLGDLQVDPNFISSIANGISGDGSTIVGGAVATPYLNQAFRWSEGQMSGLGYLRDKIIPDPIFPEFLLYPESTANATSYDGSVIVGNSASYNTRLFETEAFRWEDGVMIGLGDLPGGLFYSDARSVSADGSIIVGTGVMEGGHRAFIWDELHGMRLLEDVLIGMGLDLQGWKLTTATDISADGSVIVGFGINPNGVGEPFRAVIPEPASLALIFLGFGALFCRRLPETRRAARL